MTNINAVVQPIPKNLPITNERRRTGFDNTVNAVFPSISSANVVLAPQTASAMQNTRIKVSPESLSILMSSPNVLYGM